MIWFALIAIDLMIFLIQRQTLRSFPLIGGNMLVLSFLFLLEWASKCEKLESIILAPESEVSQTWSMQMKKNPSKLSFNIVSHLCTGYGQISLQAAFQMCLTYSSGADVQISKRGVYAPGTTNRLITIKGSPREVKSALYLVQQKIQEKQEERARSGRNWEHLPF